jgi:DNA-directed RNA polymerase II subunit RPB2
MVADTPKSKPKPKAESKPTQKPLQPMRSNGWRALEAYFDTDKYNITRHHLDSYNDFVRRRLVETVRAQNPFGNFSGDIEIWVGGEQGNEVTLSKPTIVIGDKRELLLPNMARLRDATYAADLHATLLVRHKNTTTQTFETKKFEDVRLGSVPIMLHSCLCALSGRSDSVVRDMGECPFDQGGYFIVDGREKVLVAQERLADNRVLVRPAPEGSPYAYLATVRCAGADQFPHTLEFAIYSPSHATRANAIVVRVPHIAGEVSVTLLFRALGEQSDKAITELVTLTSAEQETQQTEFLRHTLVDGSFITTQDDAIAYLATKMDDFKEKSRLMTVLAEEVFPNVSRSDLRAKAMFLGHVVAHLVRVATGTEPVTDRDSYVHARIDISGFLMANLFRDLYNALKIRVLEQVDRQHHQRNGQHLDSIITNASIPSIFDNRILDEGFQKSLRGQWAYRVYQLRGQDKFDKSKESIVQELDRLSYIATCSHLRRVRKNVDEQTARLKAPRLVHGSTWGMLCPCETPDGGEIGFTRHLAATCQVTFGYPAEDVYECLRDLGVVSLKTVRPRQLHQSFKVLVNGTWVGVHEDAATLVHRLRLLRRNGMLNVFTSICWTPSEASTCDEVRVYTDGGRPYRPLLIVDARSQHLRAMKGGDDWKTMLLGTRTQKTGASHVRDTKYVPLAATDKWDELEKTAGCVEFLDAEETSCCLIAMDERALVASGKQYTHCELHPSTILGSSMFGVPIPQHNASVRNQYGAVHCKQGVGTYVTNYGSRMDTSVMVHHYPQRPLLGTWYASRIGFDRLAHGVNVIAAVACFTGYNQEDSIIINRAAIDRGLFSVTVYKTVVESESHDESQSIVFSRPLRSDVDVDAVDKNGFPIPESVLSRDAILFGKRKVVRGEARSLGLDSGESSTDVQDASSKIDWTCAGMTVDRVYAFPSHRDGTIKCKTRLRKVREPHLGNKFAARHGQKGVCGMILDVKDMPFCPSTGLVPDIIINPHAFPSRMTIGQIIETVLGRTCCEVGRSADGTAFGYYSVGDGLKPVFVTQHHGNDFLYDGSSGEQIKTEIFMGPVYYQCLKHMVDDKINARGSGRRSQATRQPVHGRSVEGGQKLGQMEMDCITAHGASAMLKESVFDRSDRHSTVVDAATGSLAIVDGATKSLRSESLETANDFREIKLPYSFQAFSQELQGMSIRAAMEVGDAWETRRLYENDDPEEYIDDEDCADGSDGEDGGFFN